MSMCIIIDFAECVTCTIINHPFPPLVSLKRFLMRLGQGERTAVKLNISNSSALLSVNDEKTDFSIVAASAGCK